MRNLHSEWFPLDYSENYFKKALKNSVIAIGAFYETETEELMVGTIMTRVEGNKATVVDILYENNTEKDNISEIF
jgi:hypothetical protein